MNRADTSEAPPFVLGGREDVAVDLSRHLLVSAWFLLGNFIFELDCKSRADTGQDEASLDKPPFAFVRVVGRIVIIAVCLVHRYHLQWFPGTGVILAAFLLCC